MENIQEITLKWIKKNKQVFLPNHKNTLFLHASWCSQVLSSLVNNEEAGEIITAFTNNDNEQLYLPSKIIEAFDNLYEIIPNNSSGKLQKNLVEFRNSLLDNLYKKNESSNTSNLSPQTYINYWGSDKYVSTPPDIHNILSEILWLLIQLTKSDQIYLYLADFPYQTYNPFMALGSLTLQQKRYFFAETLRPDLDILLSSLIQSKSPIQITKSELNTSYPSYIYQNIDIKNGLAIPIYIEERVLGFILLNKFDPQTPTPFTDTEIKLSESITSAMALALDNSRLYELTNQRLLESQSINDINLALLQNFDLKDVLNIVCENAIALTQGIGSTIHLLNDDESLLKRVTNCGFLIHTEKTTPVSDSFLNIALQKNEAILINKSTIDQKLPDGSKFSVLAVPLTIHHRNVGVLDIIKKRNKFSPDDIRIIQIFADQAAIAIEHAKLYQQAGHAAKLEERQKMARNLHDSVNQNLYAILLHSRTVKKLINANRNEKAVEMLSILKDTTKEALNDLRIFIHELRPSILEDEGLAQAIMRRLESVEEKLGFSVSFSYPENLPDIPIDIQEGYYRITQEALNNIVKHAKADKINVLLSYDEEYLTLKVQDNGIGFSDEIKHGYGLKSMQERANIIDAKLTINSEPNIGSVVEVEVKLW